MFMFRESQITSVLATLSRMIQSGWLPVGAQSRFRRSLVDVDGRCSFFSSPLRVGVRKTCQNSKDVQTRGTQFTIIMGVLVTMSFACKATALASRVPVAEYDPKTGAVTFHGVNDLVGLRIDATAGFLNGDAATNLAGAAVGELGVVNDQALGRGSSSFIEWGNLAGMLFEEASAGMLLPIGLKLNDLVENLTFRVRRRTAVTMDVAGLFRISDSLATSNPYEPPVRTSPLSIRPTEEPSEVESQPIESPATMPPADSTPSMPEEPVARIGLPMDFSDVEHRTRSLLISSGDYPNLILPLRTSVSRGEALVRSLAVQDSAVEPPGNSSHHVGESVIALDTHRLDDHSLPYSFGLPKSVSTLHGQRQMVPEPPTMLLIVGGIGFLSFINRR